MVKIKKKIWVKNHGVIKRQKGKQDILREWLKETFDTILIGKYIIDSIVKVQNFLMLQWLRALRNLEIRFG